MHPMPNRRTPSYATSVGPCSQGGWQGDDKQETDNGDGEWMIGDQGWGKQCQHYDQHPTLPTDDPAPATSPASHCLQGGLWVLAGDSKQHHTHTDSRPNGQRRQTTQESGPHDDEHWHPPKWQWTAPALALAPDNDDRGPSKQGQQTAAVPHSSDRQGPTTIMTEHLLPALQATACKVDCGCCSWWWVTTPHPSRKLEGFCFILCLFFLYHDRVYLYCM
jgi:hypothetical protein